MIEAIVTDEMVCLAERVAIVMNPNILAVGSLQGVITDQHCCVPLPKWMSTCIEGV